MPALGECQDASAVKLAHPATIGRMIHVLMISLDTSLATQPESDARHRHLAYAERAGRLTIVVYTPPGCRRSDPPLARTDDPAHQQPQ